MMAVRPPTYSEPFGTEADQDSNTLLMELEKGLRSSKIGEQCEAIIRFPTLFDKYPFPILINSSFLKLVEFFHGGSNLIRLWVLRVCQQSEKHLEKILYVDQFVKRIFNVIHSNDPVARALTLRTLGAVAGIIPEKQDVHHAIRRALDSHDTVEVEAAIQASVLFAAQSKTFAVSMCSKISSMIESLQTPISMKLKLIPVLRHMHHDASTAALVKTLCINLLPKYPSESFVIVILDSLTQLSSATLVDIPDQVNLLIQNLKDPRHRVRIHVLKCLQILAERGAHLWPKHAIIDLISFARCSLQSGTSTEQTLVLSVILALTKCPVTCHILLNEEVNLELCSACLVSESHTVASQTMAIMTSLIAYCYNEKVTPPLMYLEQINLHLESLIFTSLSNETLVKEFAQFLKCGVRLAEKNFNFGENFVELIGGLLTDECGVFPNKHSILMVETLGALCSQFYLNENEHKTSEGASDTASMDVDQNSSGTNPFNDLLPQLLRKMESLCEASSSGDKPDYHFIEILSAVCLQGMLGHFMPQRVIDIFDKVFKATKNLWTQYRIARSASRYGHHYLAAHIYQHLCKVVSEEKYYFYLTAMFQISQAECVLLYGTTFNDLCRDYVVFEPVNVEPKMTVGEKLDIAINLYWKALSNLKATSSGNHSLSFQTDFVKLRAQFLEALHSIVIVRNTQCITPPPAIAQTLAQNSRDNLQKYGHVTNQLRKTVKTLKICEESYQKLYKSAFDADPGTLEHLEIMQYMCSVLGHSVETICFVTPSEPPAVPIKASNPETRFFLNNCLKITQELKNLPIDLTESITNKHTDVILAQIDLATRSPICFPRFFFQTMQSTSIKLSLTPQPRNAGEPVVVQPGSNLVVKVEGVVQNNTKNHQKSYRQIDSVQLTLVSQLITPRPPDLKSANDTIVMNQTVKPHKDFLTGSFLLPFNNVQVNFMGNQVSLGGQWQVSLETCVIDTNGLLWNTGPKSSLVVKVPEDQKIQSFQPAPMRRF